jgi:PAS domain S-box-containing protein
MKHIFTTNFLDVLFIRKAQQKIAAHDLQGHQRFNLFRTFSLFVFLIGVSLSSQILSIYGELDFVSSTIILLTCLIAVNYFLLNKHKNFRISYVAAIVGALSVLHVITYYSGGIRNSGMMYLGGLILCTFMLLGNREGKIVSAAAILNLIYFYFITNIYGDGVRNILDTDPEGHMLNLDYMISYVLGVILIYGLSNNLESSKNIVIASVMESKIILEKQNDELKKLSLVASNTDNAVIITGPDGIVEWVNDGFTRLTGYDFSEIIGHDSAILYGPLTNVDSIEQINERIINHQSFSGELQKYHKDGHTIWFQVAITPIFDENKQLTRFIKVESDITERKEAEEKMAEYYKYLEKANKELDKFAYVVSHDLKAPLRAISNLTVWIEEDIGDKFTSDTLNHFKMLKGRVDRMEGLINGILDYSKADRIKSPNIHVDVHELINEIIEMLVQDENIKISLPEKLPTLFTERMKLQQVFSNLISNSIKHGDKETTEIKVSCEEVDDDYLFAIEDNGPGIAEQYHEKIFVIFQTLQARDTFESTGVGLAIVKKIVDEIGGKIWVESEEGKFARFMLRWPKQSSSAFKPFQFTVQQPSSTNSSGQSPISFVA